MIKKFLIFLAVIAPIIALFYVSGFEVNPKTILLDHKRDSLYKQIEGVVYVEASDVSQCRQIEFGHKPCGGPSGYLVYSVQKTNEVKLRELVEKFNEISREINNSSELMSTCDFEMPQKLILELESGKCTISR